MKWTERIGRRLKLSDLHLFITVVEMGSMGKAAERLALSQSSVSKAIGDLEHTIGVRLLDRTVTGVAPTAYGLVLCKRSMGAFDELRQGARRHKIELEELLGEPWLLPGEGFSQAQVFQSQGFVVPKFGVTSYSVYHRILLLTTGRFIGVLSGSVMRFSPAVHASLSVLPVAFSASTWPVAIVKLKGRTISPVVQTFIECIRDVARPLKKGQ
jgi:DNA-binding transcriptional LysR family regulator